MNYRWVTFPSLRRTRLLSAVLALFCFAAPLAAQPSTQADLRNGGDHVEILLGKVSVQSLSDGRVAVAVDRFDTGKPDSIAERVFILNSMEPIEVALPIYLEAAEVAVRKDRLLVMSLEQPLAVGAFLSDAGAMEMEQRLAANLANRYGHAAGQEIVLLSGYGLADFRGHFRLPVESWPPEEQTGNILKPKGWEDVLATKEGGCRSGGAGSSSCSIDCATDSGCGVTCQEGFYACCNCTWGLTPGCSCVYNGNCGLHPCEP